MQADGDPALLMRPSLQCSGETLARPRLAHQEAERKGNEIHGPGGPREVDKAWKKVSRASYELACSDSRHQENAVPGTNWPPYK